MVTVYDADVNDVDGFVFGYRLIRSKRFLETESLGKVFRPLQISGGDGGEMVSLPL